MSLRVLLALAALALPGLAAAQPLPIRIGAFLAVTGPAAFLGDPEQKTLALYVEKVNAAGGVLGRKLELHAYDSAGDAEKARAFVKRLIEQDKVFALIGYTSGAGVEAALPMIEETRVPMLSPATGSEVLTEFGWTVLPPSVVNWKSAWPKVRTTPYSVAVRVSMVSAIRERAE